MNDPIINDNDFVYEFPWGSCPKCTDYWDSGSFSALVVGWTGEKVMQYMAGFHKLGHHAFPAVAS